jgi:synaptosomal-associated protein 25
MDDPQTLHHRANQLTNESVEATHRMKNMMEEATSAGVQTLVMLDEQGEQLNRIEEGMDQINSDMRKAEDNLDNLEKCCGCCVCPWNKAKNPEKGTKYRQTWSKQKDPITNQPGESIAVQNHMRGTNGMVKRITNDEREDIMEDNLQQVGGLLGNLKNMAIDMGQELDKQNEQVERITNKAEMNQGRIHGANERANKILQDR